jgi:PKD repeat protein
MSRKVVHVLSRAFSAIMVVGLLTMSLAVPMVSAAGEVVFVDNVTLQDGTSSVTVVLQGFTDPDVGAVDFRLYFDPTLAKVTSVVPGNLPSVGYAPTSFDNTAGWAFCGWSAATGSSGTFTLCTITFAPVATGGPVAFQNSTQITTPDPSYFVFKTGGGATITPTSNLGDLTVLPPSTVWVDDDWSAATDGEIVGNGYIYGYNAFDTIQGGIDAVASPGTVNVAAGAYTENLSITKNSISVIGADGVNVTGGATITGTTGVTIENMSFTGTVECDTTDDTTLRDLTISSASNGIYVHDGGGNTVTIDSCYIAYKTNGIYVVNDTVIVNNTTITFCTIGIYADTNAHVTVSGGSINFSSYGIYATQNCQVSVSGMELANNTTGVYLYNTSNVTVTGCSRIYHNTQYGFFVSGSAMLTANGNNIYNNSTYGVYSESSFAPQCSENWWGDDEGPIVNSTSVSPRDGISLGILYSPWLDAPCNEGGDPVGASAKFKAASRTGEPGQKVQFTDQSTPAPGCTIEEWLWNFGDGSTSTVQNPSHVYNREGNFTVTLTVWDSCGFEQTITMKAYITIKKPTASTTVEPAKLGVSYLNIDPAQVLPNQEVTISANICNSGEERGTKTVSLMVNGEAVASQSVGVSGGSCQQVVFKTSRAVPGTYQVAIDGMTGEFSVLAPRTVTKNVPSQQQTGLGTTGIIAIIAVLIVLVAALIVVFKRD